jgi:hypothetical protein
VNTLVAVCPVVPSVTVTVYEADAAATVGVPDNTPVEVFTNRPVGNDGLTAYERVPRPPVTTGVCDTIAVPVTNSTDEYPVENSSAARGVLVTAVEYAPVPAAFTAATRKSYAVPFTSPVTTAVVPVDVPSANGTHKPDGLSRYCTT